MGQNYPLRWRALFNKHGLCVWKGAPCDDPNHYMTSCLSEEPRKKVLQVQDKRSEMFFEIHNENTMHSNLILCVECMRRSRLEPEMQQHMKGMGTKGPALRNRKVQYW